MTDRLSLPQRIVVVVGLGLLFAAIGASLPGLFTPARFGWYAYAPIASAQPAVPPGAGLSGWPGMLVWLVLIAVWAFLSVRILRPARPAESPDPEHPDNP